MLEIPPQGQEEIDKKMLEKIVPRGTVLKRVYLELQRGNYTFGRQIGSYPIVVVLPYKAEIRRFVNVKIVAHGERSVTAVIYPMDPLKASLDELRAVPGIGMKKAVGIIRERKNKSKEELITKYPELQKYV